MLSDVENVDTMLGSYSREDEDNNASGNEANLDSGSSRPQRSSNVIGEDFRSLLKTNSRENSEITIETTRMIREEISNQMSRKLNDIKNSLNFQIQDAISSAITEKLLPSTQNTLKMQGSANYPTVHRRSSELQRNSEVESGHKVWENPPGKCFTQENSRQMSRQSSVKFYWCEQNHDIHISSTVHRKFEKLTKI